MQQLRYGKAFCIAPYFPKEAGSPGWFAVFYAIFMPRQFRGEIVFKGSFLVNLPDKMFLVFNFWTVLFKTEGNPAVENHTYSHCEANW